MAAPAADSNLLFGILALQLDFIGKGALIEAMHTWVLHKDKPLGQILVEQGALAADLRDFVDGLILRHVQAHNNDPQQSLAALGAAGAIRAELQQITDADVHASLAHIHCAGDVDATGSYDAAPLSNGARFRILRLHARGGLGEVFVAHDEELHREVALKEIDARHAGDPRSRARFVLEAEITGKLEHPGIVPVYALGQHADGRPYYAMRFIQGDSLKDAIARFHRSGATQNASERSLAFRELLGRFTDVCQAIQYAHDRGVLHRDLKPSNIMLGKYGETLVVDWGLAKAGVAAEPGVSVSAGEEPVRPAAGASAQTVAGSALGTPAFMSPEQAAGRLDLLGRASDVYSLGATLYCLLTGQPPFDERDMASVLHKVQRGDFRPPRLVQPQVPAPLEAICLKAMALRPEERYASARVLAEDIAHWLADEPVSAWREPARLRAGRWMRRHKPLVSGLAVALVALAVGGFWYQQRRGEAARQRAVTEQAVSQSLDQAKLAHDQLQMSLQKPGGVQELLNQPARWEIQLRSARAAWQRAEALAAQADGRLEAGLQERLDELDRALAGARSDYELALRLEKIRLDKAGNVPLEETARAYARVLQQANVPLGPGRVAEAAAHIRLSPLKQQLLAALDDYAIAVRSSDPEQGRLLLEAARRADPDPWRDRARALDLWQDAAACARLAAEVQSDASLMARLSPQLLFLVGNFLEGKQKSAWLRQAQDLHPGDFWLNVSLGRTLLRSRAPDAAAFLRVALALRPGTAAVYTNLGQALRQQGDLPAALEAHRKGLAVDPSREYAWLDLGQLLHEQGDLDASADAYKNALAINRKSASAWAGLAAVRDDERDVSKGGDAYRNLGAVLYLQKELPGAVDAYQKALRLDPEDAAAAAELERCRRLLALEKKVPEVVQGAAADATELLALAQYCQEFQQQHRWAALLYARAFAADATLVQDLSRRHRFRAACASVLAASKKENRADSSALREQGRAWLHDDLAAWKARLEKDAAEAIAVHDEIADWRSEPGLVSVREPQALAALPQDEPAAWQRLWSAARALASQARERYTQTEHRGQLKTEDERPHHPLAVKSGVTYALDLVSTQFDACVRLVDEQGATLAENDDRAEGKTDARILYTAAAPGNYRVIVTSFEQRGRGAYTLTIRAVSRN